VLWCLRRSLQSRAGNPAKSWASTLDLWPFSFTLTSLKKRCPLLSILRISSPLFQTHLFYVFIHIIFPLQPWPSYSPFYVRFSLKNHLDHSRVFHSYHVTKQFQSMYLIVYTITKTFWVLHISIGPVIMRFKMWCFELLLWDVIVIRF
jgi:hypothetical protein